MLKYFSKVKTGILAKDRCSGDFLSLFLIFLQQKLKQKMTE